MNIDRIVIEGYLKAWGWFVRTDRSCKMYSGQRWDFVGENPVDIEDSQLQRMCSAMRLLKESKQRTYVVLHTLYVDDVSVKQAGWQLGISRQTISDKKLDGIIFLSGFLLGVQYEQQTQGEIQHWGQHPMGPLESPPRMKEIKSLTVPGKSIIKPAKLPQGGDKLST